MKRDSFVFYTSFSDAISELEPMQQLAVYQAIVQYASTGDMPELSGVPKAIMTLIKPQIDANTIRYENGRKGAEHGKKGGRPRKKTDESTSTKTPDSENGNPEETPSKPQENPAETPNVNVNDNDLEKEKIQKEKDGIDEPSDQPTNPVNNHPTHAAHEVAGSAAAAKEAKAPDPDFEAFWEAYGKKRGRRDVEAYWARLPARDKAAALSGVPGYVAANPDPAYRKDPIRYLRHRCWEDENYSTTDKKPNEPHDTERPTAYMARYF